MVGIFLTLAIALGVSNQEVQVADLSDRLLKASCRVNVNPGTPNRSYGTATFVSPPQQVRHLLKEDEVLALSAGHVLEGITVRGSISVTIPILNSANTEAREWGGTYPARYLDFITSGSDGDIGMIAVTIPKRIVARQIVLAPMASERTPSLHEGFFAVGCRDSGLPKIERAKALQWIAPRDEKACHLLHAAVLRRPGDSGGGLFDSSGALFAVSSGCDEKADLDSGPGLKGFIPKSPPPRYQGPSSVFYPNWVVLKLPIVVGDTGKSHN